MRRGVTIIEALITLALVGVVLSLVLQGFSQMQRISQSSDSSSVQMADYRQIRLLQDEIATALTVDVLNDGTLGTTRVAYPSTWPDQPWPATAGPTGVRLPTVPSNGYTYSDTTPMIEPQYVVSYAYQRASQPGGHFSLKRKNNQDNTTSSLLDNLKSFRFADQGATVAFQLETEWSKRPLLIHCQVWSRQP